ncbi:YheU family protein [Kaarinaea lacus]
MKIPHQELTPDTLQALIEEFVLREGTDYGESEVSLAQKSDQIMNQLESGEIMIVFDPETETCNIIGNNNGISG